MGAQRPYASRSPRLVVKQPAKTVRTGDGPACPPGAAVANELPTSAAGSTGAAALATDITAVARRTAVADQPPRPFGLVTVPPAPPVPPLPMSCPPAPPAPPAPLPAAQRAVRAALNGRTAAPSPPTAAARRVFRQAQRYARPRTRQAGVPAESTRRATRGARGAERSHRRPQPTDGRCTTGFPPGRQRRQGRCWRRRL